MNESMTIPEFIESFPDLVWQDSNQWCFQNDDGERFYFDTPEACAIFAAEHVACDLVDDDGNFVP